MAFSALVSIEKTIEELWTNEIYNDSRKKLFKGDRSNLPCNVCDVQGSLIGNKHREYWEKKLDE